MTAPDSRVASSQMSDPRAAIQELIRGRDVAARLKALLRRSFAGGGGGGGAAEDDSGELAEELMMSFTRALAALDSGESSEARRVMAAAGESSLCSEDGKSEASTGKRKIRPAGDRRGGQRRRSNSYSWTVTTKALDDGHTWRKYGQKDIHSAKFPRSYFRCTHKHDQGCQATRQVQKSEDDPSDFLITYTGHHTCTSPTKSGRRGAGDSFLISFGAPEDPVDVGEAGGRGWPAAAAAHPASKQECVDEDARSTLSRNDSSSEPLMPPQLPAPGTSTTALAAAGTSGAAASDVGDATSGLQSSCMCPGGGGLDMDPAVNSFFEDVLSCDDFGFDFTQFDGAF